MNDIYKELIINGGCTLNKALVIQDKENGFMVSLKGYETTLHETNINMLEGILEEKILIAEYIKNSYIGIWWDKEEKTIYVDISVCIYNKDHALEFGRLNKQLAIYDIKDNKVIDL